MRKTLKKIAFLAVIAAVAAASCDNGSTSGSKGGTTTPTAQKKTWSGIPTNGDTGTANVTVNYTAVTGTTPSYMSTLETVVKNIIPGTTAVGNLTIYNSW